MKQEPLSERITVEITPSLRRALDRLAEKEDRPLAHLVRRSIARDVERLLEPGQAA
jgi:predicted transcriptional regulator